MKRFIDLLLDNHDYQDENEARSHVTGLEHALQTATRAERDGASDDDVIMALFHDAARPYNDANHGAVMAEMLFGVLPHLHLQAIRYHGLFQRDYLYNEKRAEDFHSKKEWFDIAVRLARWDSMSFDPEYKSESLEHFFPVCRRIFDVYGVRNETE